MKTRFTIGAMEVEVMVNNEKQVIKTPEIDVQSDVTIGELSSLYNLQKEMMGELPGLVGTFVRDFLALYETIEKEHVRAKDKASSHKAKHAESCKDESKEKAFDENDNVELYIWANEILENTEGVYDIKKLKRCFIEVFGDDKYVHFVKAPYALRNKVRNLFYSIG